MKKNLTSLFIVGLFAIILGCGGNLFAQNAPMVGGYKTVSVKDKQVIEAATFAVDDIAEKEDMDLSLDFIRSAQLQVGQFFNFKMFFQTSYSDGGETYELCINAQVSRSIKKEFKLVRWDSRQCPKK